MKVLVTLKDGSKQQITDLEKIVYPGYESIQTVKTDEIDTFFLYSNKPYVFVGSQTLTVEAGQILTVQFS